MPTLTPSENTGASNTYVPKERAVTPKSSLLGREPAILISTITSLITEVIGLLVAFNVNVTDAQQTAIISTVTAVSGIIFLLGPITRQFVYSPNTTEVEKQEAYEQGLDDGSNGTTMVI